MDFANTLALMRDAYSDDPVEDERVPYLRCLHAYASTLPKPCNIVELGTYKGRSAFIMACAISGTGSRLITVDPVFDTGELKVPDAHQEYHLMRADIAWVKSKLMRDEIDTLVVIIPAYSHELLDVWGGGLLDMVFLDAEHTREAAFRDSHWATHIKPGGIFVVDDWIEAVKSGCLAYFSEKPDWTLEYESTAPQEADGSCITRFRRTGLPLPVDSGFAK